MVMEAPEDGEDVIGSMPNIRTLVKEIRLLRALFGVLYVS